MMDDADKTQEYSLIDDLERLRQQVNDCERRYQTLVETNLYGILVIDSNGAITYINTVQGNVLGYPTAGLEGRDIWPLLAGDEDRTGLAAHLKRLAADETDLYAWTGRYLKESGETVQLKQSWNCMRNETRHVTGFVGFTIAVAGEKPIQMSMARRASESAGTVNGDRYRRIAEAASELILTADPEGGITYMNEKGLERLGYFQEELLEMNIADILPPDQLDKLKQTLGSPAGTVSGGGAVARIELINRSLNLIPMETSAAWIRRDGQAAEMLVVGRDLTARLERDRQMMRSRAFESVRAMADGLRRELHALVAEVSGPVDAALAAADPDSPDQQRLASVREALRSGAALARRLGGIAGVGANRRVSGPLAGLVRQTANKALGDSTVRPEMTLPKHLWPVAFNGQELGLALFHIIVNARESMPTGGRIRIAGENVSVDEEAEGRTGVLKAGRYVRLRIIDHGVGIPQSRIDHIFDPYFTTKDRSGHRGLGLTLADAIVRRHGGLIFVESKPKYKTELQVFLPAARK